MKKIILIFAVFLMALPLINAATGSGCVVRHETFENSNTLENWTTSSVSQGGGHVTIPSGAMMLFKHEIGGLNLSKNTNNFTIILGNISVTYGGNFWTHIQVMASNYTGSVSTNPETFTYGFLRDAETNDEQGRNTESTSIANFHTGQHAHNVTLMFIVNKTTDSVPSSMNIQINGTGKIYTVSTDTTGDITNSSTFRFGPTGGTGTVSNTVKIKEVIMLNGTPEQACETESVPDTTPPEINTNSYNMTSEGGAGCTNWRTDKSNSCSTSDTTPTVNFTTNENAWCAIGTQNLNFSNYTRLAINRNCTGGQGSTAHTCTLVDEDELVYETAYIYIGCADASNNSNLTSTSGALALSITGLEAAGRTSIGRGIQNALLSSYTNYTDLQIYARNLSNYQVKGTFDRAVKKGSKMLAFNRIGVSDSHVNMFNLTPVLYTLEIANKTSSNITLEVEKLLNATK